MCQNVKLDVEFQCQSSGLSGNTTHEDVCEAFVLEFSKMGPKNINLITDLSDAKTNSLRLTLDWSVIDEHGIVGRMVLSRDGEVVFTGASVETSTMDRPLTHSSYVQFAQSIIRLSNEQLLALLNNHL